MSPTAFPAGPKELLPNLRLAFVKALALPLLLTVFFAAATPWYNNRLKTEIIEAIQREPGETPTDKAARIAWFQELDLQKVCEGGNPLTEDLRLALEEGGVGDHFARLEWSLRLSVFLVILVLGMAGTILILSKRAGQSPTDLTRNYRLGWKIGILAALTKLFLLIPLLGFGCFELTTLASDSYYPQLILIIVVGGTIALWQSVRFLLKTVPLEFSEPLAREVTPAQAPELWQAVRLAASRLSTAPPEHVLIGMQPTFYVTELAVVHGGGRVKGRTLYLSHPLLKHLSPDEVMAVIGHELAHFIGEDTRITREFYPLRFKTTSTMAAMSGSPAGWTSLNLLNFFSWAFGAAEQAMSRERELLADGTAATLTTPHTIARALVKAHLIPEALGLATGGTEEQRLDKPFDTPLGPYVRQHLGPDAGFWARLFDQGASHPLDTHPPLRLRLQALDVTLSPAQAMASLEDTTESAFDRWLGTRTELFEGMQKEAEQGMDKVRNDQELIEADYETPEGKLLLDKVFPEVRWKRSGQELRSVISICVVSAVFLSVLGLVLWHPVTTTLLLLCAGYSLYRIKGYRTSHPGGEFILRADSFSYTGWNRPLMFLDVRSLSVLKPRKDYTVVYHLDAEQPPFWRNRSKPQRFLDLDLEWVDAPQEEVLRTLQRYLSRRPDL